MCLLRHALPLVAAFPSTDRPPHLSCSSPSITTPSPLIHPPPFFILTKVFFYVLGLSHERVCFGPPLSFSTQKRWVSVSYILHFTFSSVSIRTMLMPSHFMFVCLRSSCLLTRTRMIPSPLFFVHSCLRGVESNLYRFTGDALFALSCAEPRRTLFSRALFVSGSFYFAFLMLFCYWFNSPSRIQCRWRPPPPSLSALRSI